MKKLISLLVILFFGVAEVNAVINSIKPETPQGTFKKRRDGTFVNYDNNGKKLGVYKVYKGKLVRIK